MGKQGIIDNLLRSDNFRWKKDKWLVFYTFWAIFQPPFLPGPLIYIFGLFTILLIIASKKAKIGNQFMRDVRIFPMMKFFLCLSVYVVVLTIINFTFIEIPLLLSTRISSINQVLTLTLIEFCSIWYILLKCNEKNFSLRDLIILIALACLIQGVCALIALICPPVRSVFLMFGNKKLAQNEFYLSRRGYGFSGNLLDTFGYGIGLVSSYMIMVQWTKRRWFLYCSILLMILTTALNARTGLVIFLLGVLINSLLKNTWVKTLRAVLLGGILCFLLFSELEVVLQKLEKSENTTVAWIAIGLSQGLNMISGNNDLGIEEVSFFDNFIELPTNEFQLLLGSGHHVYDTQDALGFRTDIGYYNLVWEFGLIGTVIILISMGIFLISPFFMTEDLGIKKIALLNATAYYLVLMKAILIGFNPGVMINYLVTFGLYYAIMKQRSESYDTFKKIIKPEGRILNIN